MKQIEVAELFNVTHFTVGNWENGHAEPKFCHTPTLIKFLDYDPVYSNPQSIAELLFAKRRKLGWSQRVVAQNLGVDPCTVKDWESGGTILKLDHRRRVALFLGMNEDIIDEKMKKQWNERHGK